MECQLGLGSERKVPAILCVYHDEVLYHCEELTRRQLLTKPFDLVHVDAHGDMGTGDSGWVEILERAASPDAVRRCLTTDCCNRIGIGNYVSYMALLRMPSSLTYVHNPASCDDLFQGFLNGDRTLMRIPVWSDDENAFDDAKHVVLMNPARSLYSFEFGLRRERKIPFSKTPADDSCAKEPFDIAFLAQSPNYTPVESDEVIEVLGDYLDFEEGRPWLHFEDRFSDARMLMNRVFA